MAVLMLSSLLLGLVIVWVILKPYFSPLRHIPGPRYYPVIGSLLSINPQQYHRCFFKFSQTYGPVVRVVFPHQDAVVISGYDDIRKVLITSGMECGGRPTFFNIDYLLNRTGVIMNEFPDNTWKALRNISQRHIKQFGDGLARIENVASSSGNSMLDTFRSQNLAPFDPHDVVFDAALTNITFLITGVLYKPGDPFVEKMRYLEWAVNEYFTASCQLIYQFYNFLPWLRHLKLQSWQNIEDVCRVRDEVWDQVANLDVQSSEMVSLAKILKAHTEIKEDDPMLRKHIGQGAQISEMDAKSTIISLLFAGVTTTSATFYACVNILAHRADVQQKIRDELYVVCERERAVVLEDRNKMPYTRAFIFELLRYLTTAVMGVSHVSSVDITLNGIFIPKKTSIITHLWGLHNDPDFWKNPAEFNPERFLDEDGEMLPADHPNRQHLMPFGAGPRVCLGESLAMARLFMWIAMMIQQFTITPVDDNPPENIKSANYYIQGMLRAPRYKVKFKPVTKG